MNQAVFDDGDAAGVWVNAADDPARCTFTLPAVVRRGPVLVTASTGGASPALSSWLRGRLDAQLGPELCELADGAGRPAGRAAAPGRSTEDVDWRGHDHRMPTLAGGCRARAPTVRERWEPPGRTCGRRPRRPRLLTVRAARLIAAAEVVVHDALADEPILALAPPTAERIDVGKRPGGRVPQELINALLVHLGSPGPPGRAPQGR